MLLELGIPCSAHSIIKYSVNCLGLVPCHVDTVGDYIGSGNELLVTYGMDGLPDLTYVGIRDSPPSGNEIPVGFTGKRCLGVPHFDDNVLFHISKRSRTLTWMQLSGVVAIVR